MCVCVFSMECGVEMKFSLSTAGQFIRKNAFLITGIVYIGNEGKGVEMQGYQRF